MNKIIVEAQDFKETIPERLDISKGGDIHKEIKGVLDHLAREKKKS